MSNENAPQQHDALEVEEQDLENIAGGQDQDGGAGMKVNGDPSASAGIYP
jgi:hypothetical protein